MSGDQLPDLLVTSSTGPRGARPHGVGYTPGPARVFQVGAYSDFVTKPFHLTELLTRIRAILRVKHLTDELERACAYIRELEKELPRH
jgi:FixJ family two-component response regulator